jgi:hypothetical protein
MYESPRQSAASGQMVHAPMRHDELTALMVVGATADRV